MRNLAAARQPSDVEPFVKYGAARPAAELRRKEGIRAEHDLAALLKTAYASASGAVSENNVRVTGADECQTLLAVA